MPRRLVQFFDPTGIRRRVAEISGARSPLLHLRRNCGPWPPVIRVVYIRFAIDVGTM